MNAATLHERARTRGVNPLFYWLIRAILQPSFQIYFRMSRIGREHVPESGPVILAANHRSFLDPFVIGMIARRPMYYVAKRELFSHRVVGWLLSALGAFPVERGAGDADMIETAKALLARGDAVLIFPEGTRIRPGAFGRPRRGVGRLALESGAPVVPVAVIGTDAVRRGWRVRPHKVRVRIGPPLGFPTIADASAPFAAEVTDRIWSCVMLQWEWLGGLPPLRRAAVIGAGPWGTSVAAALTRAGLEVDHASLARAGELALSRHDLVCFAVAPAALPAAVAENGPRIAPRTGVLVISRGLVPPFGTPPSAYVAERVDARATAILAVDGGRAVLLGAEDRAFARQLAGALSAAGLDVTSTADLAAVERAGDVVPAAVLAPPPPRPAVHAAA